MGLLDDAKELTGQSGGKCSVGMLDEDLRAEVEEVLEQADGRTLTVKAVSLALRNRGVGVGEQALRRHRRGDCRCGTR